MLTSPENTKEPPTPKKGTMTPLLGDFGFMTRS